MVIIVSSIIKRTVIYYFVDHTHFGDCLQGMSQATLLGEKKASKENVSQNSTEGYVLDPVLNFCSPPHNINLD